SLLPIICAWPSTSQGTDIMSTRSLRLAGKAISTPAPMYQIFLHIAWGNSSCVCGSNWNSLHHSLCWNRGPVAVILPGEYVPGQFKRHLHFIMLWITMQKISAQVTMRYNLPRRCPLH